MCGVANSLGVANGYKPFVKIGYEHIFLQFTACELLKQYLKFLKAGFICWYHKIQETIDGVVFLGWDGVLMATKNEKNVFFKLT